MTLPKISIPEIPIPFEIPEVLHAYLVHFIVAIPVILLLLELYNLGTKRRSISAFSLVMLIVLTVLTIAYYLLDGSKADAEHKLLATYLVYGSLALLVLKLFFMALRKTIGRVLYVIILAALSYVTLLQVQEGGLFFMKKGVSETVVAEMKDASTKAADEMKAKMEELQKSYDEALEKTKTVESELLTAKEAVEKVTKEKEVAEKEVAEKASNEKASNEKASNEKTAPSTETTPDETKESSETKVEETSTEETAKTEPSTDSNSSN